MKAELRASERLWALEHGCTVCGAMLDRAHVEDSRAGFRCIFCGALQDAREPESSPIQKGVGETLHAARKRRGESLERAAGATRIHERFLRALEDDAPGDVYPGKVYGRFFLREYAEYLELEPAPLVAAFDGANGTPEILPAHDRLLTKNSSRGSKAVATLAAIALVVVAALSWAGGAREGLTVAPAPSPSSSAHSHGGSARQTPSRDPRGVHAALRLVAPSWVQVAVDGRQTPGRTLAAGTTRTYRAQRSLRLTLGNAGGVVLHVNGERVLTGVRGEVAHLSFVWRDGHLIGTHA